MLKQWRYALLIGLAVVISIFISACGTDSNTASGSTPTAASGTPAATVNCVSGSLVASGSTALQPLVTAVAKDYEAKCPGATITVQGGGSGTGRTQVEAGSVGIGNSDTKPAAGTMTDLVDHQVAVVIFGVIVNSKAGVTNLTTAQLQGIYAGTIKNWKDAGGADLPIVVVSRPASSGTRATFAQYVLGKNETFSGPSALTSDATGTVVTEVGQTDGAIGYAATGQVPAGSATVVSIDGTAPTAANVDTNAYKFWNIEHMYTKGTAAPLAQALIDYVNSDEGKAEQAKLQFVPVADVHADAITAHNAVPKPTA